MSHQIMVIHGYPVPFPSHSIPMSPSQTFPIQVTSGFVENLYKGQELPKALHDVHQLQHCPGAAAAGTAGTRRRVFFRGTHVDVIFVVD